MAFAILASLAIFCGDVGGVLLVCGGSTFEGWLGESSLDSHDWPFDFPEVGLLLDPADSILVLHAVDEWDRVLWSHDGNMLGRMKYLPSMMLS